MRPKAGGVHVLLGMILGAVGGVGGTCSEIRAAENPEGVFSLANQAIQLDFRQEADTVRLVRIENKLARKALPVANEGFQIGLEGRSPLRPEDFSFEKPARQELPQGGQRLVLRFQGKKPGLQLDIVYELGKQDFFVRRYLELRTDKPLELREVIAWQVQVPGSCSHHGFGEPVFMEESFWGLEFPAGHNLYEAGTIKLVHYPGRSVQQQWTSKTAVLGVAEPGRLIQRFRQYVASFQASPPDLNLFVNYNTWWTLMPPTEQNCLALMETFRKNLWEPFGESFDTFTIDDGWDEKQSLWQIQKERFPRGFAPLVEELKKMNGRLGLWLSPSSGYNHAPWGAKAGYEVNSNPWYLCQSGPKYRRDIQEVVTRLAREYQLAFYKFDGFSATCDTPGHGHLPGPYAQEANTEAFIELMEAVRRERPGIFLDPTCGMWLSPWWLRYADAIWGSVSGDYPDIVVPAPVVRDSATTTRDAVFRQRCQEHPGYPPAAMEHLGIIVITPEKWEDNAVIVLGRGCRLLTLYINPEFFTKGREDWAFLASILRWARHHAAILAQTHLILGDPFRREPYGYAHWQGQRGILALRNPFIEPQKVSIPLDHRSGWEMPQADSGGGRSGVGSSASAGNLLVRVIYPRWELLPKFYSYGDSLELELSAYETLLIEVAPAEPSQAAGQHSPPSAKAPAKPEPSQVSSSPALAGLPVRELRRQHQWIEYELFGQPGEKLSVRLPSGVVAAWLDGTSVSGTSETGQVDVEFPGAAHPCQVEDFSQKVIGGSQEEIWKIQATGTVSVSPGVQAALHILVDPETVPAPSLTCQAQVGDQSVQVRAVRSPEKRQQTHLPHRWTWFELPLPEGKHNFTWTIQPFHSGQAGSSGQSAKPTYMVGQVGCWLWAETPLVRRTLRLEFAPGKLPPEPPPRPLPIQIDRRRQIVLVQPLGPVRVGSRWGSSQTQVVRLDQVAPNHVEQSWGRLQRNQSVWEKPMTIAGQTFSYGLGTHAESRIVYDLAGGRFKKIQAKVGRDEHAQDGEVIFQVWLDDRKVFDSGPMRKDTPAKQVEVDLAGADWLELRTLPGSDGIHGDHGNWAEAQLLR